MAAEIGKVPGGRGIAAGKLGGEIDKGDIIELRAADPLRLQNAEQARLVQIALGLRRKPA